MNNQGKILLTGASGFLGQHLKAGIIRKNQPILTLGRNSDNEIICDLSKDIPPINEVISTVIHAAGKAHIYPKTEEEKAAFYQTNVEGTEHLLSALSHQKNITHFVFISSVSVYGLEEGEQITEDTELKGNSSYAKSKIAAEQLVSQWCSERAIAFLILRLPLIVGNNPPGNLGKMIHAIQNGRYLRIARGEAHKSMVLAEDVSQLIADWIRLPNATSGVFHLTDGHHPTFYELEETLRETFHQKRFISIPMWLAQGAGKLGNVLPFFPINSGTIRKITGTFTFSDQKARQQLNWKPGSVLDFYRKVKS